MKNENNFLPPIPSLKKLKKTYLISKLPENSPLRNELKSSFEDVDKYLKVDNRIIIGSYKITFRKPAFSMSKANNDLHGHSLEYSRTNITV